ncbi:3-oxoacyl-[acyl-carrier-protein] reductase FabG-like [Zingiber officinale]|uniref:Ketoreductase domain-containing protein n=1 Tax=Zingiber officinale TaxID=94328 RepID=A0A8J5G6U3_ZINOF|nr:3-oxoacyl-[acyl-carrier-protein] reductase FabG-like [Zingiber officinale]KAG6501016.1 hypothetical protein ZIOFF_040881 [Zingiber officinale]
MVENTATAAAAAISSRGVSTPWARLEGKVVMVTGASSGIGRGLCLDLARAGCRVLAAARRVDRLESLCEEINGSSAPEYPRSVAVELDVSAEESSIAAAIRRAWETFGRIDGLVNNAGIRGSVHSPLDWSEEDWNDNIRTNLTGLWLVSKLVCKLMRDAKVKGSVVNISSIGGIDRGHLPGGLAYIASKTGVNGVTKAMALELGQFNIRVNSIAPGLFASEITSGLMKKEWLNRVAERIGPLRTFGTLDPAMTSIVRYLIHDSSEYVSGNIFIVDAGVTLPGVPLYSSL